MQSSLEGILEERDQDIQELEDSDPWLMQIYLDTLRGLHDK